MAPHSSTLAWKIPWTEEPGRQQSMGSLRVGKDWVTSLSCIGEGNDNPFQCSCLENPRDGGAWWAAIYGVTQSRTRLKWLRSSSSSRETCSETLEQGKEMEVMQLGCPTLLIASRSPVWWYKLAPQFPLPYHQRGTCALPLQRQTRSHHRWGRRPDSRQYGSSALRCSLPQLWKVQEHSQIVSFSSLANVLLRSFPMRLQMSTSENTVDGKERAFPTLAPAQPIPVLATKVTTGKTTSPQTLANLPHNFSQLTWPWG